MFGRGRHREHRAAGADAITEWTLHDFRRLILALYRAEKAAALTRWANYVLAVVEGQEQKVVTLGPVS